MMEVSVETLRNRERAAATSRPGASAAAGGGEAPARAPRNRQGGDAHHEIEVLARVR